MDASALASAETWLSWIAIAKLVAAFLVAAGVVIEFGGEWLSRPFEKIVKDAREAEVAELNNNTARLSVEAETARGQIADATKAAATANERVAGANERAAILEKEAAAANQRSAVIMHATAWRQLTPGQITLLQNVLSNHSGKFTIGWSMNDTEALALAIQFSKIFENMEKGKWDITFSAGSFPTAVVWGIKIPDAAGAGDIVKILRDAFNGANIPFASTALPPQQGFVFGNAPDSSGAILFFGSKMPTFSQPPF